ITRFSSSRPSTIRSVPCGAAIGSGSSSGRCGGRARSRGEVDGGVWGVGRGARPRRAAIGLPPCPLKVPVGLQESLLGDVLGVVVVADAIVGVRVDVAKVIAVEALEGAV